MWPQRDTLSARLVQRSKCQIDGGTRRQRGNGRVLRRRLLPQSQGTRHDAQLREILLRTGYAEIHRAREEQDKVHIVRRSARHTRVRCWVWRQHRQSRVVGSFDVCTSLLHCRFEAWFRIAIRLFEHRRTAHRRRQDCTASTNSADNRKTRGDGDDSFRPRPVHSRAESRIRQHRNRDKGRHGSTSDIRTWEGDDDTSLSTVQLRVIQMNYDDYYARQVGGALPYFTGARVQRGHGFESLFSGLLRTVAPLIKRGAVALGKRALATGAQIAGDVVAGKNVKKAAKRRATAAGRNLMQSLLNTPPPPGKRVKRIQLTAPRRRVTPTKRRQRTDVLS